jgi:hypothetical protein
MLRDLPLNEGEATALIAKLRREHSELDRRIQEFDSHPWLSSDDQIERTRLKKMKLAAKDQIERLKRSRNSN